jgi:hypothetical protein
MSRVLQHSQNRHLIPRATILMRWHLWPFTSSNLFRRWTWCIESWICLLRKAEHKNYGTYSFCSLEWSWHCAKNQVSYTCHFDNVATYLSTEGQSLRQFNVCAWVWLANDRCREWEHFLFRLDNLSLFMYEPDPNVSVLMQTIGHRSVKMLY